MIIRRRYLCSKAIMHERKFKGIASGDERPTGWSAVKDRFGSISGRLVADPAGYQVSDSIHLCGLAVKAKPTRSQKL